MAAAPVPVMARAEVSGGRVFATVHEAGPAQPMRHARTAEWLFLAALAVRH